MSSLAVLDAATPTQAGGETRPGRRPRDLRHPPVAEAERADPNGTASDPTSMVAIVVASRTAQGLTPTVTDRQVLRELGRLLADHRGKNRPTEPPGGISVRAAAPAVLRA